MLKVTILVSERSSIRGFAADYLCIFDIFKRSHLGLFHPYVVAVSALRLPAIKELMTKVHHLLQAQLPQNYCKSDLV